MPRVDYHHIDEAEVIRALSEAHHADPQIVRAAVDLCIEDLRSREAMSSVFLQLLMFFCDQLRAHQSRSSTERGKLLERAHALALDTIHALWGDRPVDVGRELGSALRGTGGMSLPQTVPVPIDIESQGGA